MLVFGTRPEAIKMAPLVHALKAERDKFEVKICVTSQHREMLDQVMKIFEIEADIDLNLMKQDQNLSNLTSLILNEMHNVFSKYQPDAVLVHGDTTTTLATSIAAYYTSIPIGHVEAGLRTYDLKAPFPEEFNRQITSKITKWHFAPTALSKQNLLSEGVEKSLITVTGNTIIDALHWVLKRIDKDKVRQKNLENILNANLSFNWQSEIFILVTAHRRENFGDGFSKICTAIRELALKYPKIHFVYPVHLKPVLLMRDVTERPEAVEAGTVEIVGSNNQRIIESVSRLVNDKKHYQTMSRAHNPYGDGFACKRIVDILLRN